MPQFYTLLTDVGQAKLANAVALGSTIDITELAVGDGGGSLPTPDSSATGLVNEVRRAPINTSTTDPDNPSWIVVEQVLPPDVGGWTIREIGIFDVDGDLIGVGNYPETYKPVLAEGSSRTQTVRFVLEVSDTAAVTLKVDPSVVLATREYVDTQRAEHEASRNHPAATTTAQGMVEKATIAEAKAGAADKFPDAAAMQAAIDDGMAYQDVAVFEAAGSTTWAVPQELQDGRRKASVTVIGGGGGAGRRETGGGGGGGGGISVGLVDLTGASTVSVTIGAGGAGAPAGTGNANGGGGYTSSFGSYLSATGGGGGQNWLGGGSGTGVGGDYNSGLGPGESAARTDATTNPQYRGGSGGGPGGRTTGSGTPGTKGSDAELPGGGGGGGNEDAAGGNGRRGMIIVRW